MTIAREFQMRGVFVSVIFGLVVTMLTAIGATAQQAEIKGTIDQQFEAFKVDDFEGAFEFASPNLKQMFQSPENFRRMITTGYPMVWRPAEVRYLELREVGGSLWQKVQITDAKGYTHLLDYQMVETADGWRIASVQMLNAPAVSA
jgi:hypothetical protein